MSTWRPWAGAAATVAAAWAAAAVAYDADLAQASSRVADALVLTDCAVVGAVILAARRRHPVGRLLLAGAGLWAVGSLVLETGLARVESAADAYAGLASIGSVVRGLGFVALVTLLPLLFPDGRLPSPRWGPVRWAAVAVCLLFGLLGLVYAPGIDQRLRAYGGNPLGVESPLLRVAFEATYLLVFAVAAAGLAAVAQRWRRGDALVRQQVGWFAAAMLLPPVVGVLVALGSQSPWAYPLSVSALPIAVGVAVLQHRLYDIDLLVNRTLVYGLLTAAVVGLYVLVVAGVGAMLGAPGAGWLSLLGVAAVAVAFQPMRAGLQRGVNRLTYGAWDEPYELLDRLGSRLAAAHEPGALLDEVVEALAEGLRLPYAAVVGHDGRLLAERGAAPQTGLRDVPLVHQGVEVGVLRLGLGALRGRRGRDASLLETLARHLAAAVHARQLADALQRSRERLVLSREEERRRLRRDLHDGLGPALAALSLQVDAARNTVGRDPAVDAVLVGLRQGVQEAVGDVRRVVEDLRPPALDELGLVGAVEDLAARLGQDGLAIRVEAAALPALPAAVEVAAYRIVAEALTNVARHASARCCGVRLDVVAGRLRLLVSDDGIGVGPVPRSGSGLTTMRERAVEVGGSLDVRSEPGSGTVVSAELPVVTT